MAGPTISVLLKVIPNQMMLTKLYAVVDECESYREENDFNIPAKVVSDDEYLEERSFGLELHPITKDYFNYEKNELKAIEVECGFYPRFDVGIYAMSKDKIDHKF